MTAAPIVPGPHDAVATTAAAALAAVLPSSEQLEPGNPQPGTEHVTSLFSAAVVADLGGPISGRVGVLVADELTSALSSSPMGQLDLAAAVQPALDAAAAALRPPPTCPPTAPARRCRRARAPTRTSSRCARSSGACATTCGR